MADKLYRNTFSTPHEVLRGLLAEFVYRREMKDEEVEEFLQDVSLREELSSGEVEELRRMVETYLGLEDEIYRYLEEVLVGWRPERLLPLDRAAIMAGMSEIISGRDVPNRIIYDYGTFAKRFSTEKSHSFVMGVLKSFLKRWRDENG